MARYGDQQDGEGLIYPIGYPHGTPCPHCYDGNHALCKRVIVDPQRNIFYCCCRAQDRSVPPLIVCEHCGKRLYSRRETFRLV